MVSAILIFVLVLSPILIPATISAFHVLTAPRRRMHPGFVHERVEPTPAPA